MLVDMTSLYTVSGLFGQPAAKIPAAKNGTAKAAAEDDSSSEEEDSDEESEEDAKVLSLCFSHGSSSGDWMEMKN